MIAIGQFQMLFLAASQTHKMPVKTPSHSNTPVPYTNWVKLSLRALAMANMFQKYKIVLRSRLFLEYEKPENKKSDREQPLPDNKPNKLFMKNTLRQMIVEDALDLFWIWRRTKINCRPHTHVTC